MEYCVKIIDESWNNSKRIVFIGSEEQCKLIEKQLTSVHFLNHHAEIKVIPSTDEPLCLLMDNNVPEIEFESKGGGLYWYICRLNGKEEVLCFGCHYDDKVWRFDEEENGITIFTRDEIELLEPIVVNKILEG